MWSTFHNQCTLISLIENCFLSLPYFVSFPIDMLFFLQKLCPPGFLLFRLTCLSLFWKLCPPCFPKLISFHFDNFSCTYLHCICFSGWLLLCYFYLFLPLWIFLIFSQFPFRMTTHWIYKTSYAHLNHLAHTLGFKIKYN